MIPFAYKIVKLKIEKLLGGTADLRMASNKAVSAYTNNPANMIKLEIKQMLNVLRFFNYIIYLLQTMVSLVCSNL